MDIHKLLSDERLWYTVPGEKSSPASLRAASILSDWFLFQRNVCSVIRTDILNGLGAALENLPELCVSPLPEDDAQSFLQQECKQLLRWRDNPRNRIEWTADASGGSRLTSESEIWGRFWMRIESESN